MLAWMDLEMTGLDPTTDVIVEIATLITDDDLRIVAEGPDLVIRQAAARLATMDPVVVEMHTKSGLLDRIAASTVTLEEAGAATLDFLAAYLPAIEQFLHYRSVDVSTIKELARRWYPDVLSQAPEKSSTHRALDDIRESIDELRWYRTHIFVPIGD